MCGTRRGAIEIKLEAGHRSSVVFGEGDFDFLPGIDRNDSSRSLLGGRVAGQIFVAQPIIVVEDNPDPFFCDNGVRTRDFHLNTQRRI